jgi:transposase
MLHSVDRRSACLSGIAHHRVGRLRCARDDVAFAGFGAENERLLAENARLRGQLDAARRAGKRQAAPFSKGDPKRDPARSGRKSGEQYGTKAHRRVPEHIDEEIWVALPDGCPCCGGDLVFEREADQYQEEIVEVLTHTRRYRVAVGRCRRCGRRAQGRHPDQTSDALGAAGVQIGPRAVAVAAWLNKDLGLAMSKVRQVLVLLGLNVTTGGLHQALGRLAVAAAPTCQALVVAIRCSSAVAADETGWRVGGYRQWLWTFVGDDAVTVYLIAPGRGYEQACSVLGADFAGVLERDGWAPYRRFTDARHQTCLAHLLRRAGEMIADSIAGQAKIPHAVRRLLLDALAVRDEHRELLHPDDAIESTAVDITDPQPLLGAGDDHDNHDNHDGMIAARQDRQAHLNAEIARLQLQIDALLTRNPTHIPNRKLLKHLANERDHLLTFLKTPAVAATNWRAEQAIRPAVVNRKNWGGNRTTHGAEVQQTLMSVIRTARQQGVCPIAMLTGLLRHSTPAPSRMLRLPTTAADPRGP